MANYVAWFGKKREHLKEREREFRALLQADASATELTEGAEEVRAATVRSLNAKRAQIAPCEKNTAKIDELDLEIQRWQSITTDAIVTRYLQKPQT